VVCAVDTDRYAHGRVEPRSKLNEFIRRLGYFVLPPVASSLRKWWVKVRNPHADIVFHKSSYVGPGFSLYMPYGGHFIVGPAVEFRRGFRAELQGPDARIEIGAFSRFTYDVLIQCSTSITIGEHCMFGQNAFLVDGNHKFRDLQAPMLEQGYEFRPLRIEDDVTVLTKCTILADLGQRVMVAAGAVVNKPAPAFCVVGGIPARVLDYYGPPGSEPPELAERSRA
jgi:acetyltransferase-like isoleucine patch superfamily enzyme